MVKKRGKRPGRRPLNLDKHDRAERSRVCARECRARKNMRYQYLEALVKSKEQSIFRLRKEMKKFQKMCTDLDNGKTPASLYRIIDTVLNTQIPTLDSSLGNVQSNIMEFGVTNAPTPKPKTISKTKSEPLHQYKNIQNAISDVSQFKTSDLLSFLDESFTSADITRQPAIEKELYGQIITELITMVNSGSDITDDRGKNQAELNNNEKLDKLDSDGRSESSDSSGSLTESSDAADETPILDWIIKNEHLFDNMEEINEEQSMNMSNMDNIECNDDPEMVPCVNKEETVEDSNGFSDMNVKDCVHFLTSLSRLNSSNESDKPFDEELQEMLDNNRSPVTNDLVQQQTAKDVDLNAFDQIEIDQSIASLTELDNIERQELLNELTLNSKHTLMKSVSFPDHTKQDTKQFLQRFSSVDQMTEDENINMTKQDKFPFLSFLLNKKTHKYVAV